MPGRKQQQYGSRIYHAGSYALAHKSYRLDYVPYQIYPLLILCCCWPTDLLSVAKALCPNNFLGGIPLLDQSIQNGVKDFLDTLKGEPEAYGFQNNLPTLNENCALFVDIDGTIADLALTPDKAFIPPSTLQSLMRFHQRTGAVAIVSGRALNSIDYLTKPYLFPAAGQHGLEIRQPNGKIISKSEGDGKTIQTLKKEAEALNRLYPHLLVEFKGLSIALHYRESPQLECVITGFMKLMEKRHADVCLQFGKMVGEIRLCGGNKGKAIDHFMRLAPFEGRTPVFIGDDITDLDGFKAVNQMSGISVQVGNHPSPAQYFIEFPQQVRTWLETFINKDAKQ